MSANRLNFLNLLHIGATCELSIPEVGTLPSGLDLYQNTRKEESLQFEALRQLSAKVGEQEAMLQFNLVLESTAKEIAQAVKETEQKEQTDAARLEGLCQKVSACVKRSLAVQSERRPLQELLRLEKQARSQAGRRE